VPDSAGAPTPAARPPRPRDAALSYAYDPSTLRRGNRITPLVDGDQAFPRMLEAIDAAQTYVHLETYIFRDDKVGTLFARALMRRARAGVACRLIIDGFGSIGLSVGFLGDLLDAGVEVLEYRPLSPLRNRWRWTRRDHRKILVVDARLAYTGGLNLGDEYGPVEMGGGGWRDTHAEIEGPIVEDLDALFAGTWHREGGRPFLAAEQRRRAAAATAAPPLPPDDDDDGFAGVVSNSERRGRTAIRRAYLQAVSRARDYIYIANAYFVPDGGVRRALIRAARRGVRVHVLTSEASDVRSVQFAGERTYRALLKGGVRIHLWQETTMHAKTAVIDDVWSTIGSYNLDYVSLFDNLEVMVQVISRPFGEAMRAMYEADLERCRELDLPTWRKRPWWRKLLARIFYRFRRWL
jgi:cardiolipin synthase A/B